MVVLGILSVLLVIVLIAINPLEMINKSQDVATDAATKDFTDATKYLFATERTTPWKKDATCRTELSTEQTLDKMPSCVNAIANSPELKEKITNTNEAKEIHMSQCNNSVALCYKPKSSTFNRDPEAKYDSNGALKAGCPGGDGCYSCSFTTNEAQECFQAMQPNPSLAQATEHPDSVLPVTTRTSKHLCDEPTDGSVSCVADIVSDSQGTALSTLATPNGLGPQHLHKAYNLPCTPGGPVNDKCTTPSTFGPQTIALILAFHAPTIENDLAVYSATYGIPPCTKANGCLTIVNQDGATSPLPSGIDSSWSTEAALDVQTAHAICQTCKILLVEANTNAWTDIGAAVRRAGLMGATVISNSYAGRELSAHSTFDTYYDQPGVGVTAGTGDWGYGTYYPASSNKVIGVGGTRLILNSDFSYANESAWSGTGSGCSGYQNALSVQTSLSNWSLMGCGTKKGISDVSAVADPSTGVAIYNTSPYSGWVIIGGTSLSSPLYAAALALQGGVPSGVNGAIIPYQNKDKFRDVTTGSNGSCGGTTACMATTGYDGPTGLGSPNLLPAASTPSPTVPQPTVTPTLAPNNTPTPTPTSTASGGITAAYIVSTPNKTYTKVVTYTLSGHTPIVDCVLGETTTCSQIPTISGADAIGQCNVGNTEYAVFSKASCPGTIPTVTPTNTPTPTLAPTATPTPPTMTCGTAQTISLAQSQPILALPGDTITNTLRIKNNDSAGCSSLLYTISSSRPSGWNLNNMPASVTVNPGETKDIFFTLTVPANSAAGNYGYQFWVARPGESSPNSVAGSVQVSQVGPTNTPTPTPVNCFQGWSNSLGSSSLSGNAGDTINQTLTITYNNPPSCGGSANFAISHSYPSGWVINNLPPSVNLTPGQSITIPFTITISTGAQVQDYLLQYWINSGGQPMNATVHVLQTAQPPQDQLFSNFNAKSYGNYALFEYSYNATGAVSGRLDVSTDPNGLNTTAAPAPAGTRYGFAFNSGSAMDASNNPVSSSVRGFIVSSPSSWTGWQGGATIYYRMYNDGDKRIMSPVKSTVVDCITAVDVLPWSPWYPAIYQGVYDARYDADHNGVINYTDYWILVRATRLR